MDTFYASRVEEHPFSECSLPGIDVRADANISQFRQPRPISGWQFLLNLFLRNDIFFRVFDLLLLCRCSRLPPHMTRGRKVVSPNHRANGADRSKRDKCPLSTTLSLTTSNSERCSGRFHSVTSDASPCSPRSIVLVVFLILKTKFFESLSAPPIFPRSSPRHGGPRQDTMTDNLAMANLFGIRGRSALVTGGTSGIGFMMARGLIINGAGTLFITGYEAEKIVQGKISVLQKLADDVGLQCKVSGFVS
jgi:hypothetical protein